MMNKINKLANLLPDNLTVQGFHGDRYKVAEYLLDKIETKTTHLSQFVKMLTSIGYTPTIEMEEDKIMISLSSNNDKVHGYMGFVAHFEFKKDGSLDNIGIYE